MLDLGPLDDGAKFCRRIHAYEKRVCKLYSYSAEAPRVSRNFRFAVLVAAHELKSKARCPELKGECLVDAVWGYNGRASWHKGDHRASPYVWSDPKSGVVMKNRYKKANGEFTEFVDTRPGVMIIYAEICELVRQGVLPRAS